MGVVFGRVMGTDADIGSNAILFYHLVSESKLDYNENLTVY